MSQMKSSSGGAGLLRIDTRLMYREHVGAQGVTAADLDDCRDALSRAHRAVSDGTRQGEDSLYASLCLPGIMGPWLERIAQAAAEIRRFNDVVVIGIGGSSLGAKAVQRALHAVRRESSGPWLHFLENIDPYYLDYLLARLDPANTAVIAISKSGGTIETVVQYLFVRDWLSRKLGARALRQQWIVTDPEHGWMRALAGREGIASLPVPPNVGGRYSVLSAVGLLPLAVIGVDIRALLTGAAANAARCASAETSTNPALELAALYYLQDVKHEKRVAIMMPYLTPLKLFGDWYCQLWAESLGKRTQNGYDDGTEAITAASMPHGPRFRPGIESRAAVQGGTGRGFAGTLPVRALGAVDQHSQLQMYLESGFDKMFTFIALDRWEHDRPIPLTDSSREAFPYLAGHTLGEVIDAEFHATRAVIAETGHPSLTIHLPALNAHTLGQLIDLYQRATIYAGLLYGINPLDQPAVEKGKRLAIARLGEPRV
jgi:glucose-6-phosphate isomerase